MIRKLSLLTVVALVALLFAPLPADACTSFRCWLYDRNGNLIACGTCTIIRTLQTSSDQTVFEVGDTKISRLANGNVRVEIDGLESVGIAEGEVCAAALNGVTGLSRVESVKVVDSDSGRTYDQFRFEPNATTSGAYREEANVTGIEAGSWAGFLGQAGREIPQGASIKYVFEVKLQRGVSLSSFAENLRMQGVFGAGSANERGELTFGHVELTPISQRPIYVNAAPRPERDRNGQPQ